MFIYVYTCMFSIHMYACVYSAFIYVYLCIFSIYVYACVYSVFICTCLLLYSLRNRTINDCIIIVLYLAVWLAVFVCIILIGSLSSLSLDALTWTLLM